MSTNLVPRKGNTGIGISPYTIINPLQPPTTYSRIQGETPPLKQPYDSHYQLSIDLESELRGISRANSLCPSKKYNGPSHNCPNKNCFSNNRGSNTDCIKCMKLKK